MKALIVRGGWPGHEPVQTAEIAARELRDEGVDVEIAETLDVYREKDPLMRFNLIVPVWTMGDVQERLPRGLLNGLFAAVKEGVGLAGWHGGMGDAFRTDTKYQFMTGGQWVEHVGGGGAHYRVRMGPAPSPITEGLSDFFVTSEQYYMQVDPQVTVLATTHVATDAAGTGTFDQAAQTAVDEDRAPGVVMPVTWTKRYGRGRVFYTSLGHVAAVFAIPEALTMLRRGLLWAAQGVG